jgi:hypothetical protein
LSSNGNNKKGKMVDWRRNKVQQLLVRGYSQWDVAEELHIDQSTVSMDVHYLRQNAQLQKHIQQKLPEEYQRCLTGMNQVLKLSWQIANKTTRQNGQDYNDNNSTITTGDDRTRLQALSLINDCYFPDHQNVRMQNKFETPGPETDIHGNVLTQDKPLLTAICPETWTTKKEDKLPEVFEALKSKGFKWTSFEERVG